MNDNDDPTDNPRSVVSNKPLAHLQATYGQTAVLWPDDPTDDPDIQIIKGLCADIIDHLSVLSDDAPSEAVKITYWTAITYVQMAHVWAVKAITEENEKHVERKTKDGASHDGIDSK